MATLTKKDLLEAIKDMPMQGILSCKGFITELGNIKGMSTENLIATAASTVAHALVEKMRQKEE